MLRIRLTILLLVGAVLSPTGLSTASAGDVGAALQVAPAEAPWVAVIVDGAMIGNSAAGRGVLDVLRSSGGFGVTEEAWAEIAGRLDLDEEAAAQALLGRLVIVIWDGDGVVGGASGPEDAGGSWCVASVVSGDTARSVHRGLGLTVRRLDGGQAVLEFERGRLEAVLGRATPWVRKQLNMNEDDRVLLLGPAGGGAMFDAMLARLGGAGPEGGAAVADGALIAGAAAAVVRPGGDPRDARAPTRPSIVFGDWPGQEVMEGLLPAGGVASFSVNGSELSVVIGGPAGRDIGRNEGRRESAGRALQAFESAGAGAALWAVERVRVDSDQLRVSLGFDNDETSTSTQSEFGATGMDAVPSGFGVAELDVLSGLNGGLLGGALSGLAGGRRACLALYPEGERGLSGFVAIEVARRDEAIREVDRVLGAFAGGGAGAGEIAGTLDGAFPDALRRLMLSGGRAAMLRELLGTRAENVGWTSVGFGAADEPGWIVLGIGSDRVEAVREGFEASATSRSTDGVGDVVSAGAIVPGVLLDRLGGLEAFGPASGSGSPIEGVWWRVIRDDQGGVSSEIRVRFRETAGGDAEVGSP